VFYTYDLLQVHHKITRLGSVVGISLLIAFESKRWKVGLSFLVPRLLHIVVVSSVVFYG